MSKFRNLKNSFIAGQISQTAFGRTDLAQYPHACKLMKNMIPLLSGGAYRRPGSFFQDDVDPATYSAPSLIPFSASDNEGYCLSLYTRDSDGQGFVDAHRVTSNTSASGATPSVTGGHAYSSDLNEVQYVQSADILYTAHTSGAPTNVLKTAADTFTVKSFDNGLTGTTYRDCRPYLPQNTTAVGLSYSVNADVGAGKTLVADAAFFSTSKGVGRIFKIKHTDNTVSCCRVTALGTTTSCTVEIIVAGTDLISHTGWWEAEWSAFRGWPRCVTFFKQRLVYGGTTLSPDSIWFSQQNNYGVFSLADRADPRDGTVGTEAFTIELASTGLNQIQWFSTGDTLLVGTLAAEWIVSEVGTEGFSSSGSDAVSKTEFGSSYHAAAKVGNETFFIGKSNDFTRALVFSNDDQSYVAEPLQLLFDEYPKSVTSTGERKFKRIQWDSGRSTLWCIDTDGNLFGMTRDRRLSITMWHEHEMGGLVTISGADYAPFIESIAIVPNPILGIEDLWLCVRRTINGADTYHIERIIGKNLVVDSAYELNSSGVGLYQTDSSVYSLNDYPLAETYVRTGLTHLEGEELEGTVSNSKGYFKITTEAVSAGNATIKTPYPGNFTGEVSSESIGLHYDSVIIPVQIEAGSQIGSSQAANKRIHQATVRLYKTMACKVGGDENNTETIDFRLSSTPMQNSAELFTGDKTLKIDCDYTREGYVYISQTEPLPFCVISVITEGQTYD